MTQADRDAAKQWKRVWGSFADRLPEEDLAYALAIHRLSTDAEVLRGALQTEVVENGVWSLRFVFGKGAAAMDKMRAASSAILAARNALSPTIDSADGGGAHEPVKYHPKWGQGERVEPQS